VLNVEDFSLAMMPTDGNGLPIL